MTSEELREECKKYKIKTWGLSKDKMIKALQDDLAKTNPSKESKNEKDWEPAKDSDSGDVDKPKEDEPKEEEAPAKKQKTAPKEKASKKKAKAKS